VYTVGSIVLHTPVRSNIIDNGSSACSSVGSTEIGSVNECEEMASVVYAAPSPSVQNLCRQMEEMDLLLERIRSVSKDKSQQVNIIWRI
jgi:hypothetical protein